jgi:undecaprenyl-diphosphatase
MSMLQVVILAIVQGLAELLPISSSAHVVVAEKLMGLDPSSPPMTLLLVMLHTGTMVAVIVFFWRQWRTMYFQSFAAFKRMAVNVVLATLLTGVIGGAIIKVIEKIVLSEVKDAQIEDLFSHLEIIAPALALAGVLIIVAGVRTKRNGTTGALDVNIRQASLIGAVQGLCLPFRGFSRSGATISIGMLAGVAKSSAEAFSFALAVVLAPPVVVREVIRLMRVHAATGTENLLSAVTPSLFGAVCAFLAGLLALKWLSGWLEHGRLHLFGIYCVAASIAIAILHWFGY